MKISKPQITDHGSIMIGITIIGMLIVALIFLSILKTTNII
jgi:preprotein translocase subunit Sec61beta